MARRILVLEDDGPTREALVEALGRFGTVEGAGDAEAFLRSWEAGPVDAVLMDRHVRGRDSLDLVARLHGERPGVPVLVMSSDAGAGAVTRALRLGARAYLAKPFSLNTLLTRLEELLEPPDAARSGE